MSIWKLSGGGISGTQTIDALGIEDAQLTLGSLVEDQLTFTQAFKSAATASSALGHLQKIILWRNGVQYFQGWVTNQVVQDTSENGLEVHTTVSGIWWWLEQTPLSGEAKGSDGGEYKERIAFAFETGDLRDHIIAVIDRAKTLGVDINVGGMSSCFDVPQITLKQMNCAEAIVELMRFIPDAVAWINYSGSTPTFNFKRRGAAGTINLTVGQPPCTSIKVNPRLELETTQVVVSYVDRNVDGSSKYMQQLGGSQYVPPAGMPSGKRQILTVSGPELDTFLPNDLFDTYEAHTVASTDVETAALAAISGFDEAKTAGLTNELTFGAYSKTFYHDAFYVTSSNVNIAAPTYRTPSGVTVDPAGKNVFIGATPPEWVKTEHNAEEVKISGTWWYLHMRNDNSGPDLPLPSWFDNLSYTLLTSGYFLNGDDWMWLCGSEYEFSAWLVSSAYGSETTIYKTADYGFVQPPAGFADALVATQDFVPYEGAVTVVTREAGDFDVRGRCLNIAGSLPAHASMKALIQGVQLDLQSGASTIELGVSKRLDYLGLVNRLRRTASDNIIWLSGTGTTGGGTLGTSGSSGGSTSTEDGTGNTGSTGLLIGGTPNGSGGFGNGEYGGEGSEDNGATNADYSFGLLPNNHNIYLNASGVNFNVVIQNTTSIQNLGYKVKAVVTHGLGTASIAEYNIIGGADEQTYPVALGTMIIYNWTETEAGETHAYSVDVSLSVSVVDPQGGTVDVATFTIFSQYGEMDNSGSGQHANESTTTTISSLTLSATPSS